MPPQFLRPDLLQFLQQSPINVPPPSFPTIPLAPPPSSPTLPPAPIPIPQGADRNKLRQQLLDLYSEPLPKKVRGPDIRDIYRFPQQLSQKWGEKAGTLGKIGGGLVGLLGGVASAAATPVGAGLLGLAMDPYEGAGLSKGALQGAQLLEQQKQERGRQKQQRIENLTKFLKEIPYEETLKRKGLEQRQTLELKKEFETPFEQTLRQTGKLQRQKLGIQEEFEETSEEKLDFLAKKEAQQRLAEKGYRAEDLDYKKQETIMISEIKADFKRQEASEKTLALMPTIDKFSRLLLEELPISKNYWKGLIKGTYQRIAAKGKWDAAAATYEDEKEGFITQLSKALGNVGTLTDEDIKRARKGLPDLTDTLPIRRSKLEFFATLIQQISAAQLLTGKELEGQKIKFWKNFYKGDQKSFNKKLKELKLKPSGLEEEEEMIPETASGIMEKF